MKRHAALGERQRVIVSMTHEGDVGLVVHDTSEHIVGGNRHGQPFALSKSGRGLIAAPRLREQDRRQRVDEREMPAVTRGMQRRCGFCQVIADDARITDLLVAKSQLIVREADRTRFVRTLGVLQRAGVKRDGP